MFMRTLYDKTGCTLFDHYFLNSVPRLWIELQLGPVTNTLEALLSIQLCVHPNNLLFRLYEEIGFLLFIIFVLFLIIILFEFFIIVFFS